MSVIAIARLACFGGCKHAVMGILDAAPEEVRRDRHGGEFAGSSEKQRVGGTRRRTDVRVRWSVFRVSTVKQSMDQRLLPMPNQPRGGRLSTCTATILRASQPHAINECTNTVHVDAFTYLYLWPLITCIGHCERTSTAVARKMHPRCCPCGAQMKQCIR